MMGLVIAIHVIICTLLIIIILIQAGRGTGLVEGFSGVESMFGTKTNALLTRATSILSTLFFITCVGLAFLSARQSKSLMTATQPDQPRVSATSETTQTQTAAQPVQAQDAAQTK